MALELFSNVISYLLLIIDKLGYFGIFIGMTIESSVFPLPSEFILIPAGALIAESKMSFFPVLIFGLIGSLVGSLISYLFAFYAGRKTVELLINKYGRFIFLSQNHLEKSDTYFNKHGQITVFLSRLVPGIRHLISLPAGFSKMNLSKFFTFTFFGAALWALVLIGIGYFFGSNVSPFIKTTVSLMIIAFSLIILLFYLLLKKKPISEPC